MQKIKIDNDIPLPEPGRNGESTEYRKVFKVMAPGDSVFFCAGSRKSVQQCASVYGRLSKKLFTTRSVTENGVNGYRVWRVS